MENNNNIYNETLQILMSDSKEYLNKLIGLIDTMKEADPQRFSKDEDLKEYYNQLWRLRNRINSSAWGTEESYLKKGMVCYHPTFGLLVVSDVLDGGKVSCNGGNIIVYAHELEIPTDERFKNLSAEVVTKMLSVYL